MNAEFPGSCVNEDSFGTGESPEARSLPAEYKGKEIADLGNRLELAVDIDPVISDAVLGKYKRKGEASALGLYVDPLLTGGESQESGILVEAYSYYIESPQFLADLDRFNDALPEGCYSRLSAESLPAILFHGEQAAQDIGLVAEGGTLGGEYVLSGRMGTKPSIHIEPEYYVSLKQLKQVVFHELAHANEEGLTELPEGIAESVSLEISGYDVHRTFAASLLHIDAQSSHPLSDAASRLRNNGSLDLLLLFRYEPNNVRAAKNMEEYEAAFANKYTFSASFLAWARQNGIIGNDFFRGRGRREAESLSSLMRQSFGSSFGGANEFDVFSAVGLLSDACLQRLNDFSDEVWPMPFYDKAKDSVKERYFELASMARLEIDTISEAYSSHLRSVLGEVESSEIPDDSIRYM